MIMEGQEGKGEFWGGKTGDSAEAIKSHSPSSYSP